MSLHRMQCGNRPSVVLGVAAVLVGSLSQNALGAGFYVTEIGTPGSLGTAGAANPTNDFSADAAWTNPAGMTGIDRDEVVVGAQVIVPNIRFDSSVAEAGGGDGGNAGVLSGVPSFFGVKKVSERVRLGISVVAPLGGGLDYGSDFVGRYGAIKAILGGLGISPSVGFKLSDRVSIGGGVSALYTFFNEDIAINQAPFRDGKVKLEDLDDWASQYFFGLQYQLTERALIGAVYRSEAQIDLEGDLKFKNLRLPRPAADKVKISWDNPQLVQLGLRYELTDEDLLVADADWEDWSQFSENRLAFEGGTLNPVTTLDRKFKDTWHVGLGWIHKLDQGAIFSVGASYDSSPVTDENRTIDLPFDEQLKLSAAYGRRGKGNLSYALGGTLMYLGEGRVDQTAQGVRFKGKFDTNLILFLGGTLQYRF